VSDDAPLAPDEIRELRGELSRAELARRVGVTALTIYRWELPTDAAEARRPRKSLRERLRQVARQLAAERGMAIARETEEAADQREDQRRQVADPDPSEAAQRARHPSQPFAAVTAAGEPERQRRAPLRPVKSSPIIDPTDAQEPVHSGNLEPHERAAILPVLGDIAFANWERAEEELIEILAGGRLATSGRALAQLSMASIQLLGRNDVRGTFSTLLPVLTTAARGELSEAAAFRAHMVATLLFSTPYGQLFDAGRVRAHVARAERLQTPQGGEDMRILLRVGQLRAAYYIGDRALFTRRLARHRAELERADRPVTRCLVELLLARATYLEGHLAEARERLLGLAERAREIGFTLVECEALGHAALIGLECAGDPREAIEICEQAAQTAERARLERGAYELTLAAASAEALQRLGDAEAARERLAQGVTIAERIGWPPVELLLATVRAETGAEQLAQLRAVFERWDGGPLRGAVGAARAFVAGLESQAEGKARAAGLAFAAAAVEALQSGTRPWLASYAHVLSYANAVLAGDVDEARRALRRAERLLERAPGAWYTALLRCYRGLFLGLQGRHDESVQQLEVARATFEQALDEPMQALASHGLLVARYLAGEPQSAELLGRSEQQLTQAGIAFPPALRVSALERLAAKPRLGGGHVPSALALAVPVARLAMRGTSQLTLLRELQSVVAELVERPVWIDEVDSEGRGTGILAGEPSDAADPVTFEFGDGCGRRFLLGVEGEISSTSLAMVQMLIAVAGLGLEVAGMRALDKVGVVDDTVEDAVEIPGVVASSPQMKELVHDVTRLARSRATVLILGESGTGKEVFARAIHQQSPRATRAYVTFNCAAVPRELFEGQLFGYRKGAFTGATSNHRGVIRTADNGTLFLDEIGDLPLELQPKLLRFLENGEVFPLGETSPVRVDVRVIAATHRDLEEMIRAGRFREDLFYRLQVVTLDIAPLRDRRDDILALARHFIRSLTPEDEVEPTLSQDAIKGLLSHNWPGNVRQVRNVIERALAFSPLPQVLTVEHLRF
jgi:tetratricopeptide (TPR) repeat protein